MGTPIMLDEGIDNVTDTNFVSLVLSKNCEVVRNVLTMPKKEALSYASNILIQLEMDQLQDDEKLKKIQKELDL